MAQPSALRANFRNLYFDIFWYGLLAGSTIAFISVYATHLGADSFQLSILTGGPAFISLLFSMPTARLLEGKSIINATLSTAIVQRLGYLAFIPLPWLMTRANETWAIILISLLCAIPGSMVSISFNSMFAEVVPAQYRAEVVGRRNALVSITMTLTTFLCGWLLDWVVFPLNYQILFGIGAFGAAMSTYHLWRIVPLPPMPAPAPVASSTAPTPPVLPIKRSLARLDVIRSPFGLLILAYLCFYTTQSLPVPINPLFWVNELGLADGQIGVGNAMFYAMMAVGSILLPRLTARYGHRRLAVVGAILYGAYPLITAFATDYKLIWIASLIGGLIWGVASAALLNRLMERVPSNDRPAHMAWHNIALNFGILAGSLLGASLVEWIGLRNGLFASSVLRVISGLILILWA